MKLMTEPTVTLLAVTDLNWYDLPGAEPDWRPDRAASDPADMLIEFAGRQCYKSWRNPGQKTTADYIANILQHGHLSVLEHANATCQFKGVSRSLTHELVRHRHFSYSQVSQRYVPESEANFVVPGPINEDEALRALFVEAVTASRAAYQALLAGLEAKFADVPDPTARKKMARQAARSVLPNATETQIVVTGNFRAWRWFFKLRGSEHADAEIRQLAVRTLRLLQTISPPVFGDFRIAVLSDGTEAAATDYPY